MKDLDKLIKLAINENIMAMKNEAYEIFSNKEEKEDPVLKKDA